MIKPRQWADVYESMGGTFWLLERSGAISAVPSRLMDFLVKHHLYDEYVISMKSRHRIYIRRAGHGLIAQHAQMWTEKEQAHAEKD